ncbi:MAG: AAA family ATPase [Candidatus Diapherotrites archaeon]|nr:AAA family ATPase [Candidatus Diapherotrites archaeon]
MLKIKKLRLKNFKSFKKAEIPLSGGFTAVAGANASGKTNIFDALLFVLGITGLKMLRISKLTELINHDASEGYAKVEIELEQGENLVLVSRYVDTRGLSVFRVDGKRKTLSEVSSFLLELGVKPTGHNFVVQGDVTRIIEMNAKQRREIIDEVAGLSEFEEKKAEAIRKLEQVEQKVKDAMIVLSEREKHLDEIEKEKAAAQKFNDLKDELASSKATILRLEAKKIGDEMNSAKNRLDSLREEVARKQSDKAGLFEQENALEKKLEEINEKIIEASSKTYSTIGREIEEKKAGVKITRNSLEALAGQFSDATGKKSGLEEERKKLLEELEEKKSQIVSLKNDVAEEARKIAELEKKTGLLSGRALSTGAEIKKLHDEAEELSKKEHAFREEYYEALVAHQKTLKEKESLEKNLAHFSSELEKLSRQVEEKKSFEEEAKRISLSKPLEKLGEALKKLENSSSGIHSIRGKIEALNEANARLTGLSSNCPTCMQAVDRKTVDRLFAQNAAKIKGLEAQLSGQTEAKKGIESQVRELEVRKNRLQELGMSSKALEAAASTHLQIKQRIDGLKSTLNTLGINALDEKQAKAKGAFEAAAKERAAIALKTRELSRAPERTEFAGLLEQAKALTAQKNGKENRVNYLESEVFHGIEKRLHAIELETPKLEKTIENAKKKNTEMEKEVLALQKELEKKEAELSKATQETRLLEEEKQRLHAKAQNLDEKTRDVEEKISQKEKQLNELNLAFSKNEIRHNDLTEELKQFENVKTFSGKTPEELKRRTVELEKQIAGLGAINMKAIERFDELKSQVNDLKEKAGKLDEERHAVLEMIGKIELRKLEVFMECFAHVSRKFSDIYFQFFGGEGRLSLTDSQKPLEGGLLIEAKYKENKLKSIDSMSGGEKSLTALAFIFAIQSFDPAPFYVFDEADAALDKENSLKLGRMIKEISKASQFITITHNDPIIKNADQIIGVALNQQKSSVIGLRVREQQQEAAQKAV